MTEDREGDCRWAWDTAPTDGSPPGPVYIGNMEDWSHEETVRRRDTNWNPWGGVWTQPLRKGATKAKWGKITFDSGRYRCCKDSQECGVQVAVKQGPIMAWHFQRQWTYGNNRKYQWSCKNESDYKGPSRFHNIVVNEIYRHLHRKQRFLNQAIQTLQKEKNLTVRQQSGELSVFRPDIFVKLGNDSWYTIEVILTHPPEREVHEACNQNLIEINLNELHCLDSDREFNKWVQNGGVQEILGLESSLAQRKRRWNDRNKRFKVDDEKAFRRSIEGHISKCRIKFGFRLDIDIQSITNIEQVTRAFEQEEAQREQAREAREAREKFDNEISEAVERNIEKYGERISRATNTYSSPDEVDRIYNEHFTKKAQDEKRKADMEKRHREIQAEIARCEELYGFEIDPLLLLTGTQWPTLNLSGPEAVEPLFEKEKERRIADERAKLAVKARAEEWRQVGYPQAIAQLEKEFGLTEEEVGCDSDFSLKEIREAFVWLAQDREKEEAKRAKREKEEKKKLHLDISKEVYEDLNVRTHTSELEEINKITVPDIIVLNSVQEVDEWFVQSVKYRDECEEFRQNLLTDMEDQMKSDSYQVQQVKDERLNYEERSFEGFKAKLEQLRKTRKRPKINRYEPFNPFDQNSVVKRNEKIAERNKPTSRRSAPARTSGLSGLAKKQKEAMNRMKRQQYGRLNNISPTVHNERLAELRKNSEKSRQKLKKREDKKGYLKQLEKLQKEVNRSGLTTKQSREAKGNLDRFVKANKGKYEDDGT